MATKTCPTCQTKATLYALFCSDCGASVVHLLGDQEVTPEPELRARLPYVATRERSSPESSYMDDNEVAADREASGVLHENSDGPDEGSDSFGLQSSATSSGSVFGQVVGSVLGGILEGAGLTGDVARRGNDRFGEPFLRMANGIIYDVSDKRSSRPLYRIDGDRLFEAGFFGRILAHMRGNRVQLGDSFMGHAIATISGQRVLAGTSLRKDVVAIVPSGNASLAMAAAYHLFQPDD